MTSLKELVALSEKATQGEWSEHRDSINDYRFVNALVNWFRSEGRELAEHVNILECALKEIAAVQYGLPENATLHERAEYWSSLALLYRSKAYAAIDAARKEQP